MNIKIGSSYENVHFLYIANIRVVSEKTLRLSVTLNVYMCLNAYLRVASQFKHVIHVQVM